MQKRITAYVIVIIKKEVRMKKEMTKMVMPIVRESITRISMSLKLVKNHSLVELDEVICELETDEALLEFPAEMSGYIEWVANEGDELIAGDTVAIIRKTKPNYNQPTNLEEDENNLIDFYEYKKIIEINKELYREVEESKDEILLLKKKLKVPDREKESKNKNVDRWINYLANAEFDIAINEIIEYSKFTKNLGLLNEIVFQSARLKELNKEINNGILSSEMQSIRKHRVIKAVLSLVNDIKE